MRSSFFDMGNHKKGDQNGLPLQESMQWLIITLLYSVLSWTLSLNQ